jgi:hypothetical protein
MTMRSRQQLAVVVLALALFGLAGCGDDDSLKADAGDDFSVDVGTAPAFDGCSSSGDIANYQWVIRETPADVSDDVDKPIRDSSADCSFTLEESMAVNEVGDWVIELTVTDAGGDSSSDTVTVTVTG